MPDTLADPAAVYAPVLEHVRASAPAVPGLRVVLGERAFDTSPRAGSARTHPAAVLDRLRSEHRVDAVCRGEWGSRECPVCRKTDLSVRLGPVIELSDSARVKRVPDRTEPGVSLEQVLAAIPDTQAVPVDAAVDVVVTTPCPAPAHSERCRVPDTVSYRYFLREAPGGTYRVVTRWQTGAV
ncbi:MAG TPA: hypothetical protein VF263_02185 [Longimicrobiaceae bacterium]